MPTRLMLLLLLASVGALSSCGQASSASVQDGRVEETAAVVESDPAEPGVVLGPSKFTPLDFDEVVGAAEAKAALREFIDVLQHPDRDRHLGVRPPRGILLVGPPGVGKTMLARATASAVDATFYSVTGVDLLMGGLGRSGSDVVHQLFAEAREHTPALIFIDELDMVAAWHGVLAKQLGTEMDGVQAGGEVYVIAAANDVSALPASLLRANRFDRIAFVPPPDAATRAQMLRQRTRDTSQAADVDFDAIAFLAEDFSGADLENLVNVAGLRAAGAHKAEVEAEDWDEALDDVRMGPVNPTQEASQATLWRTAVHEAGHAVVAELLGPPWAVRKATIVARGGSAGHTSFCPSREPPVGDLAYWRTLVAVALAGQAAEATLLDSFGPGAVSDIQAATAHARRAITDFGMDDALGPVDLSAVDAPFLTETRSEATHAAVDAATQRMVKDGAAHAQELLRAHPSELTRVAQALVACQTVRGEEVRQLLRGEALARCQLPADASEPTPRATDN